MPRSQEKTLGNAQCTALEVQQLRQRLAVSIWRDYHNHINARMKYADPSADDRYRNEDEAEEEDEVQRERGEREVRGLTTQPGISA